MNETTEIKPQVIYKIINQSENIKELAGALAKAQGSWGAPPKDKTATIKMKNGGEYTYDYADLTTIIEHTKKGLSESGLSIVMLLSPVNSGLILTTKLMHLSGQWLNSIYPLPSPNTMKPQEMGSLITYSKRYSLCALLNISADDDDDGNHAQGNDAKTNPKSNPPRNTQTRTQTTRPPQNQKKPPINHAPPPTSPPQSNMRPIPGAYKFVKGKFAGQIVSSIDLNDLNEWLQYMESKGFTKGADYKAGEVFVNSSATTTGY